MSKSTTALILAAAAFSATVAAAATPSAAPGGAINHLGVARDYSAWGLSAHVGSFSKNFKDKPEIDFTRVGATLGYNLTRHLTVYASAGMMDQDVKTPFGSASDKSAVFGLGAWAQLIDSDQLSFFENLDRYTLTAGVEGVFADNDLGSYSTVDGFLFFEMQGDVGKRDFIFPRTLGVYAGPVFSVSVSSDYESASDEAIGFGVGLSVMFTDDTSLRLGGDFYSNDSAVYAQFGINF